MSLCKRIYNIFAQNWLILSNSSKLIYSLGLVMALYLSVLLTPTNHIGAAKDIPPSVTQFFPAFGQSTEADRITEIDFPNSLPIADIKEVRYTVYVTATAYSSTVDQCDSTPCITANGFNVCNHNTEDVIATNMLPFGTKVRFPDIYGDKIFIVQDRMNAKYYSRVDFWKLDRRTAVDFGVKYQVKMEIL